MKDFGKYAVIGLAIIAVDNLLVNAMKMRSYHKTLKIINTELQKEEGKKPSKKSRWI